MDPQYLVPTPGPTRPGPNAQQDAVSRILIRYRTALAKCNADKAAIAEAIAEFEKLRDQKKD